VDKAFIENEGHTHSQISAHNSDRQNKYRSNKKKKTE